MCRLIVVTGVFEAPLAPGSLDFGFIAMRAIQSVSDFGGFDDFHEISSLASLGDAKLEATGGTDTNGMLQNQRQAEQLTRSLTAQMGLAAVSSMGPSNLIATPYTYHEYIRSVMADQTCKGSEVRRIS